MTLFFATVLPLATLLGFPPLLRRLSGRPARLEWPLVVAAALSLGSWLVPSPVVGGQHTQFSTHLVGGGLYCGFVWRWAVSTLGWRPRPVLALISLLAFTSLLGVLIELFELAVVQATALEFALADTSWDLLANTLGALVYWTAERLLRPAA